MEDDFVGAIKIKDGLFIGDEYAAQVSSSLSPLSYLSPRTLNLSLLTK